MVPKPGTIPASDCVPTERRSNIETIAQFANPGVISFAQHNKGYSTIVLLRSIAHIVEVIIVQRIATWSVSSVLQTKFSDFAVSFLDPPHAWVASAVV